jgi:CheY-like chemotaxis protein
MGDPIRVLVVDEDVDVLELTATFLERESDRITVETEQTAAGALDRAGEFDCIVSDLRMPEMDGIELFETLRDRGHEIPFFVFSAASDPDTTDRIQSADVTGFVKKGAGTDHYTELAERIERAL